MLCPWLKLIFRRIEELFIFEMLQFYSWIENEINTIVKKNREKHKSKDQQKIQKMSALFLYSLSQVNS